MAMPLINIFEIKDYNKLQENIYFYIFIFFIFFIFLEFLYL